MEKKRIALLAGGISSEREVSLKSGEQVYQALDKERYEVRRYDPQTDLPRLMADAGDIDAALIILHGPYGEDGTVQGLLDLLGIPYQGAGVLGSALAMNKLASKQLYEKAGIPTPPYRVIRKGPVNAVRSEAAAFGLPLVVKPISGGSSIGMSIVHSEDRLAEALEKGFSFDEALLLETYIDGIEITGGVLGNSDLEALPLIEIVPGADHTFFDYQAKYVPGATEEICPARVDEETTRKAQDLACRAHRALFCQGYSRTDMLLRGDELVVLETNTIPGMTRTSLFPQAAEVGGYAFGALLDRLIELGIQARGRKGDRCPPTAR